MRSLICLMLVLFAAGCGRPFKEVKAESLAPYGKCFVSGFNQQLENYVYSCYQEPSATELVRCTVELNRHGEFQSKSCVIIREPDCSNGCPI